MSTAQRLLMFTFAASVGFATNGASAQSGSKTKARGAESTAVLPYANTIGVGDMAPSVEVTDLEGQTFTLGDTFDAGRTVLVVLRGYPGYQCGICSRQASGYLGAAGKFAAAGLNVVMIYPGPAGDLDTRAEEFLDGRTLPSGVTMLIDPDYTLVDAYGLRWDAPNETAYPSTFVISKGGKVEWARISKTHGGRADAKSVLAAVTK